MTVGSDILKQFPLLEAPGYQHIGFRVCVGSTHPEKEAWVSHDALCICFLIFFVMYFTRISMHEVVSLYRYYFYEENNKDIFNDETCNLCLNVLVNNYFLCSKSCTRDTKLCGKCPSWSRKIWAVNIEQMNMWLLVIYYEVIKISGSSAWYIKKVTFSCIMSKKNNNVCMNVYIFLRRNHNFSSLFTPFILC